MTNEDIQAQKKPNPEFTKLMWTGMLLPLVIGVLGFAERIDRPVGGALLGAFLWQTCCQAAVLLRPNGKENPAPVFWGLAALGLVISVVCTLLALSARIAEGTAIAP